MELMDNKIRPYAWGSRTAIAELIGAPSPAPHPQAELWMGAHPGDSSVLVDAAGERSLLSAITDKPVLMLGEKVEAMFGPRLPFLFKVLAAAEPLSLQAHPSAAQAARGFAQEEAEGIPMAARGRNYKDGSHKPEVICALTEFEALCGFRDPVLTVQLLGGLGVPQLDHYLSLLSGQLDADGVRALFSSILTIPSRALEPLLEAMLTACVRLVRAGSVFSAEYRTALQLGERYPGDPGVLASLLLNRITLQPGQALYLSAGNLHAYLSGVGVELMANSDNVLRGGLTPKHVDVPELMKVLDFTAGPVPVLCGELVRPGELLYRTPAPEFSLSRLTVSQAPIVLAHDGPQMVLVVDGHATLEDDSGTVVMLDRGRSAWVAAGDSGVRITGAGIAFRATDGLKES